MLEQQKIKLINRTHRIEGQIRGVENMIREDRRAEEIITQLRAIASAADQITVEIIKDLLSKKSLSTAEKDYILRLMKKD